jgi:hypothetical protein
MLSYAIEFLSEELDQDVTSEGKVVRTTYGIERIPDPMLLKEMMEYRDGVNVDRLVSFAALIAFSKVQQANRGYKKRYEETADAKKLDNNNKFSKLVRSPFRHIGGAAKPFENMRLPKQAFRNLR